MQYTKKYNWNLRHTHTLLFSFLFFLTFSRHTLLSKVTYKEEIHSKIRKQTWSHSSKCIQKSWKNTFSICWHIMNKEKPCWLKWLCFAHCTYCRLCNTTDYLNCGRVAASSALQSRTLSSSCNCYGKTLQSVNTHILLKLQWQ